MNNEPTAPPPLLIPESDDDFGRPTIGTWMMIGALLIAKIGGLMIVFMIDPSKLAAMFAIVSTWLWFVVLGILLSGPTAYWWRLRKQRARRAELQRAEWMIGPDDLGSDQRPL